MGKYFTIEELCRSDTAKKKGINNTPTAEIKQRLEVLIDELLDPVREAWGKPIKVNSGYRCPKLNKAVGGVVVATPTNLSDCCNVTNAVELTTSINVATAQAATNNG